MTIPVLRKAVASPLVLLAGGLALLLAVAQGREGSKFRQVNPPGATYAWASGVNNEGTLVVGSFTNKRGALAGYAWDGSNFKTVVFPGSANFTRANDVNDSSTIVGDFVDASGFNHGYLLSTDKSFTQYDVPGFTSSYINAINDAGTFAGQAGVQGGINQGFINAGGAVTLFTVDGDSTFVFDINDLGGTAGDYLVPPTFLSHGFYRAPDGAITKIDYPGAAITVCLGVTDTGEVTGLYVDAADVAHGFAERNGRFRSSRLPDVGKMNNRGTYVGSYVAADNVNYGYVVGPLAAR